MKQIVVRSGKPLVVDVPSPDALDGMCLIRLTASCISPGTEAMIMRPPKTLLQRAVADPTKAARVFSATLRKGLGPLWKKVVETPLSPDTQIGYSACGVILEHGPGVDSAPAVGSRVAVAGAGHANHAEYCAVPKNL